EVFGSHPGQIGGPRKIARDIPYIASLEPGHASPRHVLILINIASAFTTDDSAGNQVANPAVEHRGTQTEVAHLPVCAQFEGIQSFRLEIGISQNVVRG